MNYNNNNRRIFSIKQRLKFNFVKIKYLDSDFFYVKDAWDRKQKCHVRYKLCIHITTSLNCNNTLTIILYVNYTIFTHQSAQLLPRMNYAEKHSVRINQHLNAWRVSALLFIGCKIDSTSRRFSFRRDRQGWLRMTFISLYPDIQI